MTTETLKSEDIDVGQIGNEIRNLLQSQMGRVDQEDEEALSAVVVAQTAALARLVEHSMSNLTSADRAAVFALQSELELETEGDVDQL